MKLYDIIVMFALCCYDINNQFVLFYERVMYFLIGLEFVEV